MSMSSTAAHGRASDGVRLVRYLPLAVATTLAVIAAPLLAVAQLGPARGPLAIAFHVAAAAALALVLARGLGLLWTRHEQSADLVFGDLLLWGWARRFWAERRLAQVSRSLVVPAAAGEDRGQLLRRLGELLERRDPYTHGHSRRVARHAERIARGMGLPREQVDRVRTAALVHDIGKINIPRSILTKPGRLTDAEFALVKRHAADGAVMVSELGDPELTAIVRHHHERLDGAGYPDGLAGQDIPVGARIIAVADTFDAITSARPYRRRRTHSKALEVVRGEAGTQLDADAVAAFTGYYGARASVGWAAVVLAVPQRLVSGLGGASSGVAAGVAPLTQTACGVGAAALIGACFGGAAPPASSGEDAPRPQAIAAAAPSHPPATPRAADPTRAPATQPAAGRGVGRSATEVEAGKRAPAPRERRSLEAPPPPPPAPKGGGAQQADPPADPGVPAGLPVPEVVAAPDLPAVVPDQVTPPEPVTELLPPAVRNVLPPQLQVPIPAPVPPIQLP